MSSILITRSILIHKGLERISNVCTRLTRTMHWCMRRLSWEPAKVSVSRRSYWYHPTTQATSNVGGASELEAQVYIMIPAGGIAILHFLDTNTIPPTMKSRLLSFAATVLAAASLLGCAATETSHTKEMLSSAGFFEVTPESPRQKKLYAEAPSYKIHQITAQGKTFYVYKDEKRGTAFVGDTLKFRQYQRLLMEESAAEQQQPAAMMSPQVAMGWYGAYGPYVYGPRYGTIRHFR